MGQETTIQKIVLEKLNMTHTELLNVVRLYCVYLLGLTEVEAERAITSKGRELWDNFQPVSDFHGFWSAFNNEFADGSLTEVVMLELSEGGVHAVAELFTQLANEYPHNEEIGLVADQLVAVRYSIPLR